jgi:hypothetical protein
MKSLWMLSALTLVASSFAADKRYSRPEALAQLQSSARAAQVVFVAKLETRHGKRVLVCLEAIKACNGLPAVGEVLSVDAPLRGAAGREGLVFMRAYPAPGFAGEIRWLHEGNLNECRELSLGEIKRALGGQSSTRPKANP